MTGGLAGLAAALKGHPGLTYLELGCNAFGEEGIKSLADAIKFNVPVRLSPAHCQVQHCRQKVTACA